MNNQILQLTVTNDVKYLEAILCLVREFGRIRGLSRKKQQYLELATEEAIVNAIEYAPPNQDEPLRIRCLEIPRGLCISVIDKGRPAIIDFQHLEQGEITEEQLMEQLGVLLMRGMADRIECRNLGMEGREVRIEFHLEDRSIADREGRKSSGNHTSPSENFDSETQQWQPEDVRVEGMAGEDAIDVASSIFGAYGYTYPKEDLYYPERLNRLQESGALYCAVAKMPDGRVAGTGVIDRNTPVPGLFELEALTTIEEYRALGVARKVVEFLVEHEKQHDQRIDALLMESVTNHPFSQKIAHEYGFLTTGFFFGMIPDSVRFKGIDDKKNQQSPHERVSTVFNVLRVRPWSASRLHIPKKHRSIIGQIYSQFQAPVELVTEEAEPVGQEHSRMDTTFIEKMGIGIIRIETLGRDFPGLVKQRIYQLKSQGVQVLVVYLNMLPQQAPWAASLLETYGFVFTGILPGNDQFHPMLLQWFGGLTFDVGHIQINDEVGKAILHYVKTHDQSISFA